MTDTAYLRIIEALESNRLQVKGDNGTTARAQCPAHEDKNPSLSLRKIDGQVLVYCHAGCDNESIVSSLGLTTADLFDNRRGVTYAYPGGRIVERRPNKSFPQSGNMSDTSLYRQDRVGNADLVFVVEGEKDVSAIESAGGVAVCSPMGAGKAHLSDWSILKGRNVRVVRDKDNPGHRHATQVVALLDGIALSVGVVEAKAGKDASDHLAAGHGLDEFVPVGISSEGALDIPLPLATDVTIPPFPVDAFPGPIGEMVSAVSEATQTDCAMAATSALAALSACTGGHAVVEVRPGWRESLCLYTVTIANPGERKSSVQSAMTRPLLDAEQRLSDKSYATRIEAETRKMVAVKAAERQRHQAASVSPNERDAALADAIGAASLAESIEVPPVPRLVADDVTPEAAASLLAEQGGRLAIISAEGGIFDIIAGRYSRLPNMDLWLKGHSGDPLKVDRKGRPSEYVRSPALTLGLMIQPSVLASIASNREFRGRGFLARFLYAWPVSKVGRRRIAPSPVPDTVRESYETVICNLAAGMSEWLGDPAVLTLTPSARRAIEMLEESVEPELAGDGELASIADWGAKYVGAIARIAGILHLAEHGPDKGPTTAISAVTVHAAARIGTYFKASAIKAF